MRHARRSFAGWRYRHGLRLYDDTWRATIDPLGLLDSKRPLCRWKDLLGAGDPILEVWHKSLKKKLKVRAMADGKSCTLELFVRRKKEESGGTTYCENIQDLVTMLEFFLR